MRRFYCLTLGFFLLTVRAEKEDFQGYLTEQTKGTTVKKDRLLKKENTIGHGTEAIPTENTHRHTAMAAPAKLPGAVMFDTGPTQRHERIQITKAVTIITPQSTEHFVLRNGQNSQTSARDNEPAMRIKSEMSLISDHEKLIFSSAPAALESMMNGTSEPEVHLSADALKALPWLHTLLDNRNQRNSNSVTPTSADGGRGGPILSASHPRVIDNLAALRNDKGDRRSRDEGTSNLERNAYLFGTMQSIFQSDTAEDSVRGNTVTNLCLTCLKDRRAVSSEKSVALSALSPQGSAVSLGTEGLALDFNQFATSLPSLNPESAGEQKEILNKEIRHKSITKHSSFSERLVYSQTFRPLFFNKTVNHSQSILNNFQIKSLFSDRELVTFDPRMSSVTQKDTKKQSGHTFPSETFVTGRQISTTTATFDSAKLFHTVSKPVKNEDQEMFGRTLNIRGPQPKLMNFSQSSKDASYGLSTNFKNILIKNQPSDISSEPLTNMPVIVESSHSTQRSALQEGSDHSAASHPTAGMSLNEAHSGITPLSLDSQNLGVKNPESHFLTGRTDFLISVLKSHTPATPSFQTKELTVTVLPKDAAFKLVSVTKKRRLTDKQKSQTFNTEHSIVKQAFVDPSGPVNRSVTKEQQTPTFATQKSFFPESRRDFDDDMSATTLSSKSFSENMTISTLSGSQSKTTQEGTFDVRDDKHAASTRQCFAKNDRDFPTEILTAHSPLGNKNEQVTVVAEIEDNEMFKMEDMQDKEIQKTNEILQLLEKEESGTDETLENKREEFSSDRTESGKQEKVINREAEINQNMADETKKPKAKTSRDEGSRTIGEEGVILREDKEPRQGEINDEEGAERQSVTKINSKNSTKDVVEKQRESLTMEGTEAGGKETSSTERNGGTGNEDMTNVPLGPSTNSKELNRDKGHTVRNLSSCHSLIKQSGATEDKGVHMGESKAQIVEITNQSFSYEVTSNHRPPHSTLRSQSLKRSTTTSLPEEPNTQIKPHLSPHGAVLPKHRATSSLTKKSTQKKVVEATFSVTTIPKLASEFKDRLKTTISPHSSVTKSAHPELTSISKMLSISTARLAITAGFLTAQPHFTVNSSTPNVSIIYSIPDYRHKFSASVSKTNSISRTTNERQRAEYIIPSVTPSPREQMYNDSSARPPTALSSEAHISIGQLQPHQGQSAPQISQSSSSSADMTSGLPCSFKLSEQTAHPDALHAPVDDNEQRSVQALVASMSPKAKNNQFPLSSMSPLLNLRLSGSDSLPGTYSLTGLTRSASEKKILRANTNADYANSGSDHTESLLGISNGTNQTEEGDSLTTVTSEVKHLDVSTEQITEKRNEKNSTPFKSQITGRSKHRANKTDDFTSLPSKETDKISVKNTNETNQNDPLNGDDSDEANNMATTTLKDNHLFRSEDPIMFAVHTTHKTEQAINEDFVHAMSDFGIAAPDTNDQTGTTAFVESDSLPKIQANDVTNNAIFDMKHHGAKTTEKQNNRVAVTDSALPVPHNHFRGDPTTLNKSTQQVPGHIVALPVSSQLHVITGETNEFMFLAPTASIDEDHESPLTTSESVTGKSFQATHIKHMVQSNSHIEPLSQSESTVTPTTARLTPAVKRKNTTETQSVVEPQLEISVQAIEQSQHVLPGVTAITHPINDPEQGAQPGLLKTAHRGGEAHGPTSTVVKVGYSPFQDIKTAQTTKSVFEAEHHLPENTSGAHTLDRTNQHERQTLPGKISVTKVVFGAMTDSVPPTQISPTEIINKTSCRTIGCHKSDKTTTLTIGEGEIEHTDKMHKTQAGNTGRGNISADFIPDTKPENAKCGTDCPVPGEAAPQATAFEYAALSPVASKSDHDPASVDETASKKARSTTDKTVHLEGRWTPEQARFIKKTTQRRFHRETSKAQEAGATEVTLSEPEATTVQTTIKTTERTLLAEKNTKTQLNRAEIFEAQNATRSVRAVAKGEMAVLESERRLLLPEPEQPRLKHRRTTSPHLYLSGVTEVSDDLCGSGNYTAEMSLKLGRDVEPGDAVPALGNLRVVINLKTNNSQINLGVNSCCLSPTTQPDLTNSTCCLFSRLAAEPAGITLLPSALSSSASFTISLFQMINYSVVYLHCDLSVCLRNHSDCERHCLQQRSAFSSEGPGTVVTNLRNRISFGPMLKQVKNSTFPEEIDPSELDLVLVIVSLVVGSSLVTVMLLLVWLVYRRRAIWPLHSASPPRACCGCLRPGGDLILP